MFMLISFNLTVLRNTLVKTSFYVSCAYLSSAVPQEVPGSTPSMLVPGGRCPGCWAQVNLLLCHHHTHHVVELARSEALGPSKEAKRAKLSWDIAHKNAPKSKRL